VDPSAGEVGCSAEVGIADHIQVSESGEAQSFAKTAASGALEVEEEIGVVAEAMVWLITEVEGFDEGGFVFPALSRLLGPW